MGKENYAGKAEQKELLSFVFFIAGKGPDNRSRCQDQQRQFKYSHIRPSP